MDANIMTKYVGSIWCDLLHNGIENKCFLLLDDHTILWDNGEIIEDDIPFENWRVHNNQNTWKQLK